MLTEQKYELQTSQHMSAPKKFHVKKMVKAPQTRESKDLDYIFKKITSTIGFQHFQVSTKFIKLFTST